MKHYISFLVLFGLALMANAVPVSRDEASTMAASFLNQSSVTEVLSPFDQFYIFNGNDCFVILSADDCAMPVLGYSFDGCFETKAMPMQIQGWLQSYDNSIRTMAENHIEASEDVLEAWTSLRNGTGLSQRDGGSVGPLITTFWNQRAPYNGLCPTDCYTGCVATAMAQLMKYWEYPNRGTGSYSYFHSTYGTQSANFGATVYDWDNMPTVAREWSPEPVCQALSKLFFHCGVSVDMNYGTSGSSAPSAKVLNAMVSYFNYSSSIAMEYMYDYSDEGWKNKLRNELDAARPMYYAGQSDKGAHAFLCDGYDNLGLFHFNWGWGGKDDGYYMIGALNPANQGSYNVLNYAIVGIQPASYAIIAPGNLTAQVSDGQVALAWSAVPGSVMYKVYRDGVLIDPMVLGTSYTDDAMSYGTHRYYVKAVSSTGERSPRSTMVEVDVEVHAPKPVGVDAVPDGNNLTIHWDMPFASEEKLAYGTGNQSSSMGYNGKDTYWGQRYPASMLKDYAGFSIQSVSVYMKSAGTYSLYLCQGNEVGVTDVVYQRDVVVESIGWKELSLDGAMNLDYTHDLWVVFCAPSDISYPAAYSSYTGSGKENASFISTTLSSFTSCANREISWMMSVKLKENNYTYKVLRNGALVASGLTGRSFTDTGLTSGTYDYQVWSAFNGAYGAEPAQLHINLAWVDLSVENPDMGTVQGAGLAEVGDYCTVKAIPNPGSAFLCWKENGMVVSTKQEYSFLVSGDCQLQACFSGVGIDEEDDLAVVRKVEVYTLNGEKLTTLTDDRKQYLDGYAKGVYLLRITTDKGVVIKKVVH